MSTIYCESGSAFFALDRGKLPKLMPIEWAQRRHERRQAYEAIVINSGEPRYVISMEGNDLSIAFLDDHRRCYLEYDFQEKMPNRIFLTHATHREFIEDSDELSNYKLFAFDENGRVSMGDYDPTSNTVAESEVQSSVAANWDDYPKFGNYVSLCREDRS